MKRLGILLFLATSLSISLWGQRPETPIRQPDRLLELLYSPELVMRHQRMLELTEEQREYIVEQVQAAQSEFTPVQWELQEQVDVLAATIASKETPEAQVTAQLARVLDLERRLKEMRFLLALRIRRALTEDQLEKLDQLRPLRRLREGAARIQQRR